MVGATAVGTPTRTLRVLCAPFFALDEFRRDLVLYGASACFALVVAFTSALPLYREWGAMAIAGYVLGAVMSGVLWHAWRRGRLTEQRSLVTRVVVVGVVGLSTLLVPLGFEISWRTETPNPYLHVQPEVTVIERAGQAVASNEDPYRVVTMTSGHADPAHPLFEQFFPYLPLMAAFGYVSSTKAPAPVTDARVTFLAVTLVALTAALWLLRGPPAQRLRVGQVLLVLPLGALPLVTGGDDLPIVSFLLLGLVLASRQRSLGAGLAFGVAAAMKFTAWPVALLALAFVDGPGWRLRNRMMGVGFAAVVVPIVVPYAVVNPGAFIQNVVAFPLGLTGVPSPAQTPFLGHLVVTMVPQFHRAYTVLIALVGVALVVRALRRNPPRNAAAVATFAAWCAAFVVAVAPSTRVGYLLYPLNFALWGGVLGATETPLLRGALEDADGELGRLDRHA